VLGQQAVREVIRVWGSRAFRVVVHNSDSPRVLSVERFARDQGISVERVERAELDRIAQGGQHQGVVAFAPPLVLREWDDIYMQPELLAIALDGVVDPHNFGATIRSAVGVAGAPILWGESASAPLSPVTFRASAGAIEHATLCRVRSLHGALSAAVAAGVEVLGLTPDATEEIHTIDCLGPTVLVIGSEEKGMGRAVRKACTRFVRLHQSGRVQSLNASVAAGIALHALSTRRAQTAPPVRVDSTE
jgi:23S rRNA (guanosine2251-2'-O)-methyltransferase